MHSISRVSWDARIVAGMALAISGLSALGLIGPDRIGAQENAAPGEATADSPPGLSEAPAARAGGDELAVEQARIAQKYQDLEKVLIRMAELTAGADPRRAALLRQAASQSKDRDIDSQFEKLVEMIKQDQLSLVIKNQTELHQDLKRILDLLLSEDRGKRLQSEQARIREYIQRVNKLIKQQKEVQGETSRDGDAKKLAENQGELARKTAEVAKDIKEREGQSSGQSPAQPSKGGDPQPDGKKNQDPKQDGENGGKGQKAPEEQKKSDRDTAKGAKPKNGEKQGAPESPDSDKLDKQKGDNPKSDKDSAEGKDPKSPKESNSPSDKNPDKGAPQPSGSPGEQSESPKPSDAPRGDSRGEPKKGEGQPSEGQPGDQGDNPEHGDTSEDRDAPAQKRLAAAEQRMQEARRKLEEANRQDATDKQEEAIDNLKRAVAELEKILRQLREEEIARTLALLETRFRKMLEMQIAVHEGTKRVDKVPISERDRDAEIESGRLSRQEAEIASDADRALSLLQEEGSAVAFPEAVHDMRDDMEQVVVRLAQAKVGEMTQNIEKDIIAALEEMIASLQKAQKDLEKKMQPGQTMPGEPGEPPLVDRIAELKMIRALQMRVNTRTKRYGEMIKAEQADKPDMLKALEKLAEREDRIHHVTRDIVVGRNR